MKKIFFARETYLLTDLEFKKAIESWKNKEKYYCERLEAIISDKFYSARTPQKELGYKVYLYNSKNGGIAKIFEQNGDFYKEVGEEGNSEKILIRVDNKLKEKMVDQEIFYQNSNQPRFKELKR